MKLTLDLDAFSNFQSILKFNAEIADGNKGADQPSSPNLLRRGKAVLSP